VKRGETTPDEAFTLECVECLASCGTAPVLQVNGEFVENVTTDMADALLDELGREMKAKKVLQSPQGGSTERIK
jgi:NADH:ubiquinone oxidoreductase subunit E